MDLSIQGHPGQRMMAVVTWQIFSDRVPKVARIKCRQVNNSHSHLASRLPDSLASGTRFLRVAREVDNVYRNRRRHDNFLSFLAPGCASVPEFAAVNRLQSRSGSISVKHQMKLGQLRARGISTAWPHGLAEKDPSAGTAIPTASDARITGTTAPTHMLT